MTPSSSGKRTLRCERCGQDVRAHYARWWGDDDYRELLADYFAMEQRARKAEARLAWERGETNWWREQAGFWLDHLSSVTSILIKRA